MWSSELKIRMKCIITVVEKRNIMLCGAEKVTTKYNMQNAPKKYKNENANYKRMDGT